MLCRRIVAAMFKAIHASVVDLHGKGCHVIEKLRGLRSTSAAELRGSRRDAGH